MKNKHKEYKACIEEIVPRLKEAYIKYYGEEYRERIEKTIDSLRILYVDNSLNLCSDIEQPQISSTERKIINEKINDLEIAGGCVVQDIFPPLLMIKVGYDISLHTLIHEINHSLHIFEYKVDDAFSFMASYGFAKKTNIGFSNKSDDYFYEIINDYMTRDILEIVNNQGNIEDSYIIDDTIIYVDSDFIKYRYIYLDEIFGYYMKKIYQESKEKLKDALINYNGESIYNSIGSYCYNYISNNFKVMEDVWINISKFFDDNKLRMPEESVIKWLSEKSQGIDLQSYAENIISELYELYKIDYKKEIEDTELESGNNKKR